MGPRAGLDGCGKFRPHRNSIFGPSSPQPVAVRNELSRAHHTHTQTHRDETSYEQLIITVSTHLPHRSRTDTLSKALPTDLRDPPLKATKCMISDPTLRSLTDCPAIKHKRVCGVSSSHPWLWGHVHSLFASLAFYAVIILTKTYSSKTKVGITVDGETKKNHYTVFRPKLYKYPHFNISPYTSTPPPHTTNPSRQAIKTHIPGEIGKINNNLTSEKKVIREVFGLMVGTTGILVVFFIKLHSNISLKKKTPT